MTLRIHTALYLSTFLLALHHVFVYFSNSSILQYFFGLSTPHVLFVYGGASIFGIATFIALSKRRGGATKGRIYAASAAEAACLSLMYVASMTGLFGSASIYAYIIAFSAHHLLTPYLLYNLDTLFEAYTHTADRGKGRGIYLTVWSLPFVVVPLLLSTLDMASLPVVYLISVSILIPFVLLVSAYLQDPETLRGNEDGVTTPMAFFPQLKAFWADALDRKSFITQTLLHLYYGVTGVMLPIYLYNRFGFEWGKIGIILAISMIPYILTQIPFGMREDKRHNERFYFIVGIALTIACTVFAILINPSTAPETSFLLLMFFLFFSRIGCSLIEISSETMFYKHVTERDAFALLMFRAGRLVPYAFGLLAVFWL